MRTTQQNTRQQNRTQQSLTAKPSNLEVSYKDDNNNDVKLTLAVLNDYLSGGEKYTEAEAWAYFMLCKARRLNPIERDCHLVRYGGKPTIVITRDCYNKRANAHPRYQGKESGIAVVNRQGMYEERVGTILLEGEELVGGWCSVYMEGRIKPEKVTVSFSEACRYGSNGEPMANWKTMPAWMITKVAEARALKAAIPEQFSGTYSAEEVGYEEVPSTPIPIVPDAQDVSYVDSETGEVVEAEDVEASFFDEEG